MALEAMNEHDAGIVLVHVCGSIDSGHTQLYCLMDLEGQSNPYHEL
jgi:hypothetical protein